MKTTTFKKSFKLLSLFLTVFLIVSCSNDDDNPTSEPEPTVEQLLTSTGRWYVESITDEIMDNCDKTTYWEFSGENLNEQWFYTETDDSCASGYSTSYTYDWISDTQLNITNESGTTEVTIESITQTELTISYQLSGEHTVIDFDKSPGNE